MTVGVNVRQVIAGKVAWQPVTQERPGVTAVDGFGGSKFAAKIDCIPRRVGGVNQDKLVVKSLVTHQVHVGLERIGSGRSLTVDVQRKPCLASIRRTK